AIPPIPRTTPAKNGSAKNWLSGSHTTSPIASVRRVTRLRAAWFGVYESFAIASSTAARTSGLTFGELLMTRARVARETPAPSPTPSSVGRLAAIPLRGDQPRIPVRAFLGDPLLRLVVDVDDPEPLRVPLGPFEVVEQRPDEVAADVDA